MYSIINKHLSQERNQLIAIDPLFKKKRFLDRRDEHIPANNRPLASRLPLCSESVLPIISDLFYSYSLYSTCSVSNSSNAVVVSVLQGE